LSGQQGDILYVAFVPMRRDRFNEKC
jgi:hypothetical protein